MPTWLVYSLSIIEVLIKEIMAVDPVANQGRKRAVPQATGDRVAKIAKFARLKSALKITAESPQPDAADMNKRLQPRVKK